jgi:hypothetical protein
MAEIPESHRDLLNGPRVDHGHAGRLSTDH